MLIHATVDQPPLRRVRHQHPLLATGGRLVVGGVVRRPTRRDGRVIIRIIGDVVEGE